MAETGVALKVTDINTERFNVFAATPEELIADALEEAGLVQDNTLINGLSARELCQSFHEKRSAYKENSKLGFLLVEKQTITEEQLSQSLEYQSRYYDLKLGEVLVNMQVCSKEDVEAVLQTQQALRRATL